MATDFRRAVFLSYASQDAEAARRVCEALREAGVEVWFDQSELRGGDAWDQKIRRQIRECALFVPIISVNTQARREGYFRLEWKLADDRTHLMAKGTPFLLPVCIDHTKDWDAIVPDSFTIVQWMRLPDGQTSPAFCERVRGLLCGGAEPDFNSAHPRPAQQANRANAATNAPVKHTSARPWVVLVLASVGAIAMAAIWQYWTHAASPAVIQGVSSTKGREPASSRSQSPPPPRPPHPAVEPKSIAVLPFANLSPEEENAFFADGMHEELLTALVKIPGLKVISRTSVLAYRDPAKRNLREIAAELGVMHVLEGSVRRAGNQVRITVQLIDATTDVHRWADNYTGALTDVFQLQADISERIAHSLAASLSPEQKLALGQRLTSNPAAYDLFLRARRGREALLNGPDRRKAKWEELIIAPLEQAVALDPKFAAAFAELGRTHSQMYWWSFIDGSPARLTTAKAAIDAALRIDSSLPLAHLALGSYYYHGFLDYARATEEYAIALAALPGDADVLYALAITQRRQGRWAEATANLGRAFGSNPRIPAIGETWVLALMVQRLYRQAEQAAEKALVINPANDRLATLRTRSRLAREQDPHHFRTATIELALAVEGSEMGKQFLHAFIEGRYADAVRFFGELSPRDLSTTPERGIGSVIPTRVYYFAATATGAEEQARSHALAAIARANKEERGHRNEWLRLARLALDHVYAGIPDEARRLAARSLELMPVKRDALDGTRALYENACTYLALGDLDRALALLEELMMLPNDVIANEVLYLEPWWKPLHDNPRFKAALAKAAPRD